MCKFVGFRFPSKEETILTHVEVETFQATVSKKLLGNIKFIKHHFRKL